MDWLIARKTSGRTQKSGLQTLLRLGLYQMFWLDRVPDHATVNETVRIIEAVVRIDGPKPIIHYWREY